MAVKAIIFDLDGTLVDSLEDLADSTNYCLKALGMPVHKTEDYKMIIGTGTRELCRKALPAEHVELTDKLLEMTLAHYAQNYMNKTKPYAGVVEALDELSWRGLHLGVLSNKPDDFVNLITRQMFGPTRFEMIVGQQDGVPTKPDPTGVLNMLKEMQVGPEEALYVGDSGSDMQTARAAGMCPVGVSWGFRSREELTAGGAKHIIDKPGELLELL